MIISAKHSLDYDCWVGMRKNIPITDIYMEEGWSRSCLESVRIIDGGMLRMSIADTIIMIVDE